jgi:uncharacterized surface protein with fasciclin (FAS1) repeats
MSKVVGIDGTVISDDGESTSGEGGSVSQFPSKNKKSVPPEVANDTHKRDHIYEINTSNGDSFQAIGTLMLTPFGVVVGDGSEGDFKVMVPYENLVYLTVIEDFVDSVVA